MAHKIGVGHINIHGAGFAAQLAVDATARIATNANDTNHAPQAAPGSACANVIAKRTIKEYADKYKDDEYNQRGQRNFLALHEGAEIFGALQDGKCHTKGQ